MENKRKSIILHLDSLSVLDELSNEQAGVLFKEIKKYFQGESSDLDFGIKMAFLPFKNQFVRDVENYKKTCEQRKIAGSKGGKQKVANATNSKRDLANVADNDSKNDSKNDNDSKNINNIFNFKKYLINFGFEEKLVNEWLLVRKKKKATNSETAFNKFIAQVELSKLDKNKILEKCIERSWSGFESEWLKNTNIEWQQIKHDPTAPNKTMRVYN